MKLQKKHILLLVLVFQCFTSRSHAGDSQVPRLLELSVMPYPEVARTSRVEGRVSTRIVLNSKGAVQDVRILSGNAMLKDWVSRSAKTWVFTVSGAASFDYIVSFQLEPESDSAPQSRIRIDDAGLTVITQKAMISH
jgi:hypothetical protein